MTPHSKFITISATQITPTLPRRSLRAEAARTGAFDDFVMSYRAGDLGGRVETERFWKFTHDELMARDKASLDIFWLRDESLEETDNLPAPEIIAAEIVEDLRAALEECEALAESLAALGGSE